MQVMLVEIDAGGAGGDRYRWCWWRYMQVVLVEIDEVGADRDRCRWCWWR